MAYDRFLIAPIAHGLQTDLKPFLIPDDAFAQLSNAYIFRGRVKKRFGSTTGSTDELVNHGRLAINISTITGTSGTFSVTVPGNVFKVGQQFVIGTEIFTVTVAGTPGVMLTTGTSTVHTYNTTNGALVITGAPAGQQVYFYPAEPVMGIALYENGPLNNQPTFVFDTQYVYQYNGTQWLAFGPSVTPFATYWQGGNDAYFWDCTWQGVTPGLTAFFTTNFNATIGTPGATDDTMWVYNGTWNAFTPQFLTAGNKVISARIIVSFKNRLLLLNTIEQNAAGNLNTAYIQRCRFSQNGSPLQGTLPLCAPAWLEQTQALSQGAGFIDATTEEAIVTAEFIKDRLIVYFERSTWEIVWTGNNMQPFIWQKINTELGSESTFSTVPFDKVILTVGQTGIHACNGANVERIDTQIPDQVFNITDKTAGTIRVTGIRDYFNEMVYWTFPSDTDTSSVQYCNQVLAYNYQNNTWAFFDDSITALGYFFGASVSGQTWAETLTPWSATNYPWNSGSISAQFRDILAGNQQGFLFIINNDVSWNAPSLQISSVSYNAPYVNMTIIDHNLAVGDWVTVENCQGSTNLNNTNILVEVVAGNVVSFSSGTATPITLVGVYTGGGTLAKVSNVQILSKEWNPYLNKGRNFYLAKIDFGVTKTTNGQITVDWYTSTSQLSMLDAANGNQSEMGTNILETSPYPANLVPLEQTQDRLWHPVYFQADGSSVQIYMHFTNAQMANTDVTWSDFELQGMVLHVMPTGERIG